MIMKKIVSVIKRLGDVVNTSVSIEMALWLTLVLPGATACSTKTPSAPASTGEALIARAKSLELDTPYVPPPGDPLQHHASGFAKIMCSAVFITGLDPEFAAENVGYFTSPYAERAKLGKPVIDRDNKAVHVTLPNGVKRTAKYIGDQGCVTLPAGNDSLNFTPVRLKSRLPDPSTQPWPMGDAPSDAPLPAQLDAGKVRQAVDAAFEPASGMTAAFVVTWRGRIIGERYGEGITLRTPLESWSMGKSLTATLMGMLIKQGVYDLWQPAPIPEWQGEGDPRAQDSHRRHPAHVERSAHQGAAGSRLRSVRPVSRSPVSLHGRRQLFPLCRYAPAAVAARHGRPLSQY